MTDLATATAAVEAAEADLAYALDPVYGADFASRWAVSQARQRLAKAQDALRAASILGNLAAYHRAEAGQVTL